MARGPNGARNGGKRNSGEWAERGEKGSELGEHPRCEPSDRRLLLTAYCLPLTSSSTWLRGFQIPYLGALTTWR